MPRVVDQTLCDNTKKKSNPVTPLRTANQFHPVLKKCKSNLGHNLNQPKHVQNHTADTIKESRDDTVVRDIARQTSKEELVPRHLMESKSARFLREGSHKNGVTLVHLKNFKNSENILREKSKERPIKKQDAKGSKSPELADLRKSPMSASQQQLLTERLYSSKMQQSHQNFEQNVKNLIKQMDENSAEPKMSPKIVNWSNFKTVRGSSSGTNGLASAAISELIRKDILKESSNPLGHARNATHKTFKNYTQVIQRKESYAGKHATNTSAQQKSKKE